MHGIDRLEVWLKRQPDGSIKIYGQHLYPDAEYEYWFVVAPTDLPLLATALGTTVDGIELAWKSQSATIIQHGESRWLTEHEIPYDFGNWHS